MINFIPVALNAQRPLDVSPEKTSYGDISETGGALNFQDILITAMVRGMSDAREMVLSVPVTDLGTPPAKPSLSQPVGTVPPPSDQAISSMSGGSPVAGTSDASLPVTQPSQGTALPLHADGTVEKPAISRQDPFQPDLETPLSRSNILRAITDGPSVEIVRHQSVTTSPSSMTVGVFLKTDPTSPSLFIVPMNLPRGMTEGRVLSGPLTLQQPITVSPVESLRSTGRSHLPSFPVEPKWVIDQLVSHLRTSTREGRTEIRIQLRPEHMGKMVIRVVSTEDGTLSAKIYVANQDVRNLIVSNISSLHEALHEQGLTFSQLDVLVADEFAHGSFDESSRENKASSHASAETRIETTYNPIAEEFLREAYGYRAVNISA